MTRLAQESALIALRNGSFRGVALTLGVGPGVLRRLVDRTVALEKRPLVGAPR